MSFSAEGPFVPLEQVGQLPIGNISERTLVVGDSDHDGLNEIVVSGNDGFQILEHQGSNVYSVEHTGGSMIPFGMGDLDGDGKTDLFGMSSGRLRVYESESNTAHPSEEVWATEGVNTYGFGTLADTDRDGRQEMIVVWMGLHIFENTGDNSYEEVFFERLFGAVEMVVGDLDGDEFVEIVLCNPELLVLESPADNVWESTWRQSPDLVNAWGLEGGRDNDGNGRPEIFVTGNWREARSTWTTRVYEATSNDQFGQVAVIGRHFDGWAGAGLNALGNFDGVGGDELAMHLSHVTGTFIYTPAGPGRWLKVQQIDDSGTPHAHDVNGNGRDELFLGRRIWEQPEPTNAHEDVAPVSAPLAMFPNPCRPGDMLRAALRTPGSRNASTVAVFDTAGRLLGRQSVERDAMGRFVWPVRILQSGVYWMRLEDPAGNLVASGRAIVVR